MSQLTVPFRHPDIGTGSFFQNPCNAGTELPILSPQFSVTVHSKKFKIQHSKYSTTARPILSPQFSVAVFGKI